MPMAGNPTDKRTMDPDMPVSERNFIGRREAKALAISQTGMPDWAPTFLEMMAKTCNVRASCMAAGISSTSAYNAYQEFPVFRQEWENAKTEGRDILLQEAWRRALHGSDRLLGLLLKMYYPEYFPRNGMKTMREPQDEDTSVISGERIDYDNIRERIAKRYLPPPETRSEEGDPQ